MLAMLFGCGFRRSELVGLESDEVQILQVPLFAAASLQDLAVLFHLIT